MVIVVPNPFAEKVNNRKVKILSQRILFLISNCRARLFSLLFAFTGNPLKPVLSGYVGPVDYDRWKVTWMCESFANITEYRLLLRKVEVITNYNI